MSEILGDVRVLDLTIARAGPTAVRLLADWGAVVTRIEMPGDDGIVREHDSADYINLHCSKRLLTLNLKCPQGQAVLEELLSSTDVVVENFRAPVKERLGLNWSRLSATFPRLILASVSGYGQSGPEADLGAVDQIIQGYAGIMSVTGSDSTGPTRAGIAVTDLTAGMLLANGILLALLERQRSGQGQWVTVSLLEAAVSLLDFHAARFLMDDEDPSAAGNHHPSMTPMGTFRCADGHLNIGAPSDRLWERLCIAIERVDLTERPEYRSAGARHQHRAALIPELEETLLQRSSSEWASRLTEASVPWGPVNTVRQLFDRPQTKYLALAEPIDHPLRGRARVLRNPITMSRSKRAPKRPAPISSQHTNEILTELGYSTTDIEGLRASGVI